MVELEVAKKIKQLRVERNITLETLASRTGFTKSYLSKIETNKSQPPIGTLFRIAGGLEVDISVFFPHQKKEVSSSVVKKNDGKKIAMLATAYGYSYESLAFKMPNKKMEPFMVEFPPHEEEITLFQHDGEEVMYVIEGELEFTHGENEYILEKGDCIYFDSNIPHGGKSHTKQKAVVFAVINKSSP